MDLSGTSVVAYSGIAYMAGGLEFSRDSTGAIGPQINATFSNLDGLSRDDRLRYDTPRFGGFKASASVIDGGSWDVAGRFSGEVSGAKVAGAVAYAERLCRLLSGYFDHSRSIYAVCSGQPPVSANVEAFVDFMELYFNPSHGRKNGRASVLQSVGPRPT